jgi:large subunit ribosomal protein L34
LQVIACDGILAVCHHTARFARAVLLREEIMKRTFQPKNRRRLRVHGFRKRMQNSDGQNVIKRRRARGRHNLSVFAHKH